MANRSYCALLWILVVVGLGLDLGSKYAVFSWLYNEGRGDQYVVIPGGFEILAQYSGQQDEPGALSSLRTVSGDIMPMVNRGALFGFAGSRGWIANAAFAGISIAAALAILYWSTLHSTVRDPALCGALGLILGGTLGNLYDRLVFGGVRDFIHWHYGMRVDWPVFNIADSCLVCGAMLLLAQAFFTRPTVAQEDAPPAATPNPMLLEQPASKSA